MFVLHGLIREDADCPAPFKACMIHLAENVQVPITGDLCLLLTAAAWQT